MKKTQETSGADEKTPSYPQYFSWINNTDEGSTEKQTLINLEYFKWLRETYGMKISIYALDAGNLDGGSRTYENPRTSKKLKKQFPNGYGPLAKKAAEIGCRLGIWAGADGFGDSDEEEQERIETMVSFCRDYNFAEFKVDTACDWLREEKRPVFKAMIDSCRRYVPDLLLLNHRQCLGDEEICATTTLWNGDETYIDIHLYNTVTASHHRACTLTRGVPENLMRLTEDHGVCLSSCLDYFDDDLIMQAFSRSLILAPEIYGNPWFLNDAEQARLAKIYNWHEKYNQILVNGMQLPAAYGIGAVSRGNENTRLLVMSNASWDKKTVSLTADDSVGLAKSRNEYIIKYMHPYEAYHNTVRYGQSFDIEIEPFRAVLVLIQEKKLFLESDFVIKGARYETVYGSEGKPQNLRIFSSNGKITSIGNEKIETYIDVSDNTVHAPRLLGETVPTEVPANAVQLYETTMFQANSDSLERQSLMRSGSTAVLSVQNARNAFFDQATYILRGVDSVNMFDGNPETFYDAESLFYKTRIDGGCLRVDLGSSYDVNRIEIECFSADHPSIEIPIQLIPNDGEWSLDLLNWTRFELDRVEVIKSDCISYVKNHVHSIEKKDGKRLRVIYTVRASMRYFKLPEPMNRIYSIKIFDKAGEEIHLLKPHANNMLSPNTSFTSAGSCTISLPTEIRDGSYLAMGIEGNHGIEGVYCAAECEGKPIGSFDRAPSYPVNVWEYIVRKSATGYTYYFNITPELRGKEITLYALYRSANNCTGRVWLCDGYNQKPITVLDLNPV